VVMEGKTDQCSKVSRKELVLMDSKIAVGAVAGAGHRFV
jgi:hypothetical protein